MRHGPVSISSRILSYFYTFPAVTLLNPQFLFNLSQGHFCACFPCYLEQFPSPQLPMLAQISPHSGFLNMPFSLLQRLCQVCTASFWVSSARIYISHCDLSWYLFLSVRLEQPYVGREAFSHRHLQA